MMRAFLLSLLVRQRLKLREGFSARYPHAWLIWEPGAWTAPSGEQETTSPAAHQDPAATQPGRDALCFELIAAASPLVLGRASSSGIPINDATLSREHARLHAVPEGWDLEAIAKQGTRVGGVEVAPGQRVRLTPGAELVLGGIRLTFYDVAGMVARLVREWN
jgi:hypothetical protein